MLKNAIKNGRLAVVVSALLSAALVFGGLFLQVDRAGAQETATEEATTAAEAEDSGTSPVSTWLESINLDSFFGGTRWYQWAILLGAVLAGLVAGRLASAILRRIGRGVSQAGYQAQAGLFEGAGDGLVGSVGRPTRGRSRSPQY